MNFFSYEYDPNIMFDMYTSMHLLMLGLFFVYVTLFFIFKNRIFKSKYEKQIRYTFASFLLVTLITLIIIEYSGGHVYLPLHLCSISYILTIILLYTNNEKIFRYVFFAGVIGGIVSFAIPDLYHAGYNRFRFYEFVIAHGSITLIPIYYLTCYKYKITKKITIIGIIITNILGIAMLPVNLLIRGLELDAEANYMFSMGPPEDVVSIFQPFPWHYLTFEVVLLVTFFGMYYLAQVYQGRAEETIIK